MENDIKTISNILGIVGLGITIIFYLTNNMFGVGYGVASINCALLFRHYEIKYTVIKWLKW